MTDCNKPVKRKVRCESNWLRGSEVILTVYPHSELGFREPCRRIEWKLSLKEALRLAVINTTNRIESKAKQLKKDNGITLGQARKLARKELL